MTPEQYRAKWGLPSTYPMVAPNYAAQRSALAKAMGLGQLREKPDAAPLASAGTIEVVAPAPSSAVVSEAVATPQASAETIDVIVAPPEVPVKRKPGRPRKAAT